MSVQPSSQSSFLEVLQLPPQPRQPWLPQEVCLHGYIWKSSCGFCCLYFYIYNRHTNLTPQWLFFPWTNENLSLLSGCQLLGGVCWNVFSTVQIHFSLNVPELLPWNNFNFRRTRERRIKTNNWFIWFKGRRKVTGLVQPRVLRGKWISS